MWYFTKVSAASCAQASTDQLYSHLKAANFVVHASLVSSPPRAEHSVCSAFTLQIPSIVSQQGNVFLSA